MSDDRSLLIREPIARLSATPQLMQADQAIPGRHRVFLIVIPFLVAGIIVLALITSARLGVELIPAIVLTALAIVICLQQRTWLAPAAFFGAVWALLVWLALGFASDIPVSPDAVWWIVGSVAVLWVGTCLGIALDSGKANASKAALAGGLRTLHFPALTKLIIILSLVGCGAVVVLLRSRGEGWSVLLSLERLAALGRGFAIDRYSFGYTEPLAERALTVAIYCASFGAGLALASPRSRSSRCIALLPLVPASAVAAILTTKAVVLFSIVIMAGSFLAARVVVSAGRETFFRARRLLTVVGLGALLVPGFVVIQLARYGYSLDNPGQVLEAVTRLRIGLFSYAGVFSSWFESPYRSTGGLHLGAYTFAGAFSALGLQERTAGLYTDSAYIGTDQIPSNIYTIFRGLIEDFGWVGSMGFLLAIGFIAGIAFARLRKGNVRYLPILAGFYACSLWSFVVDIFIYNTILVAWLLFTTYVLLWHRKIQAEPLV